MSRRRALAKATGYEDFRAIARHHLPRVVFDSIDGGAGEEKTIAANREAFGAVALLPRQASPPAGTSTRIELLGERLDMPILLAPCGSTRIVHPSGERGAARAAAAAGTTYVIPHLGGTLVSEVRQASTGSLWYQIYQFGSRDVLEPAIERARVAGIETLVVTVDNARTLRPRDVRNGMDMLLAGRRLASLPYLASLATHPRWLAGFVADGSPVRAPNAILPDGRAMGPRELGAAARAQESYFSWSDLEWLRSSWNGRIVIKGILTAADARRSRDCGMDAIIVSNHGGRSLDGLEATLRALPSVVAATPELPVLLDSGVRNGTDVIKALCLGARAVLIGRPYMFALSCGEAGVTRLLEMLSEDLHRSIAALGCANVSGLTREFVRTPSDWPA